MFDCCFHHRWNSLEEVIDYLPRGWREYVAANVSPGLTEQFRHRGSKPSEPVQKVAAYSNPLTMRHPFPHPGGDRLPDASNSDPLEAAAYLAQNGIEHALLCHDAALLAEGLANTRFAVEAMRAINDWTIERWLSADGPFSAAAVVATGLPEAAAAEIRRVGADRRIVAVVLGANVLGRPFGDPVYHPIYEAAAEHGLVVIVHAEADAAPNSLASPTAAGPPATFTDFYALRPQGQEMHALTLICQGVFERYPSLRVLLVGAGPTWVPPFLWRCDTNYQGLRTEAPWMKLRPSDYFREFFRVATYPLVAAPSADRLEQYLDAVGHPEEILCFASGYPRWDALTPEDARRRMPAAWWPNISRENARELFQWGSRRGETGMVVAEGET